MNDPVKIIWKYRNNQRWIQYNIYIFVGDVPKEINDILLKIKDLSFYDTLIHVTRDEYKQMEKFYGEKWYTKFFNTYHLNVTILNIKDIAVQKTEILGKYGDDWFKKHIERFQLISNKFIYSYGMLVKAEFTRKNTKRGHRHMSYEEDSDVDYTTTGKLDIKKIFGKNDEHTNKILYSDDFVIPNKASPWEDSTDYDEKVGGGEDEDYDDEMEQQIEDNEFEQDIISDDFVEEESDDENIDKIYEEIRNGNESDVVDENLDKTTQLLKKAFHDENIIDEQKEKLIPFDQSKDTSIYEEQLRNVYNKIYVTSQLLLKDDTIKKIKEKICCSIRNNDKFGKNTFVIPSRQYLWSQYIMNDKVEKVMIGQKWMKRNELLNIDVEPNNTFRIYEELKDQLKTLRDDLKRNTNKIRLEDDQHNILNDYEDFITNNELYMIDLYNELGLEYNPNVDKLRNLQDVYLKIYFPRIKDDIKQIIDFLNDEKKLEVDRVNSVFNTINNDVIMENEITNIIENTKRNENFSTIFQENYIIQCAIHVDLRTSTPGQKLNLYRIFNEFETSEKYPFIQFQSSEGQIVYKFNENEIKKYSNSSDDGSETVMKWLENAPYGISFKVKTNDSNGITKFTPIRLSDTGRIEYKTQWKEEEHATNDDIKKTYKHVEGLIEKINNQRIKTKIIIPEESEYKFAFVSTIQKFDLPDKFIINHNDLSDFARNFYPYVAVVIDPKKRQAKIRKENDKSKFGTYLRYKRISKYENQTKIEQRIVYFIRNYDFTEEQLANQISKQFNITYEHALDSYKKLRLKYPNIRKSRKTLKTMDNIPKYKPPGIGIDIQGRQREKYKIRISGARDNIQLERIRIFINILIYLYVDTYLYKKKDRQYLKDKLNSLTHIAKRIGKVDTIVDYSKEVNNVKEMAKMDKMRIGFKPEKGQNQWTRSCQNSGNKRRQPKLYQSDNMSELLKRGYHMNKRTGQFEKKVLVKERGKKKEITLSTIKLSEYDEDNNLTGNEVHYACEPELNGEYFYVGFLTKSPNPNGQCMPCCFKKNQMDTTNKKKREFFENCLGRKTTDIVLSETQKIYGDKLYILQDTNKIPENRTGFLPKYLDVFFNTLLNLSHKIKHHYLLKSDTGYYFKHGISQENHPFLNSIATVFNTSVEEIRERLVSVLEKDKKLQIFTSLNNGDIKTQFNNITSYIDFIKTHENLDYDIISNLISLPNVMTTNGVNIVLFLKHNIVIRKTLEKEKVREDFVIRCQYDELAIDLRNNRDVIFLIQEEKNFYPIVFIKKHNENDKTFESNFVFKYDKTQKNIVNHVHDFYYKNCSKAFTDDLIFKNKPFTARKMKTILDNFNKDEFRVNHQFIDSRNKCRYLILKNNMIIPTRPSGSIYDIGFVNSYEKYLMPFQDMLDMIDKFTKNISDIKLVPVGVYYDVMENDKLNIQAIMLSSKDIIPVLPSLINISDIKKLNFSYEKRSIEDKLDIEITSLYSQKLNANKTIKIDERVTAIGKELYETESLQIFRLEFSNYLNKPENQYLKTKIKNIVNNPKLSFDDKSRKCKLILYRLIDKKLYDKYRSVISSGEEANEEFKDIDIEQEQHGGKYQQFVNILQQYPNVVDYRVDNDRELCDDLHSKDMCNPNIFCKWSHDKCKLALPRELIIKCVNKVSEDFASNNFNSKEVLQEENYFVSDIVDYDRFTERENQILIRNSSSNLRKIFNEIFGSTNIPTIGKKKSLVQEIDHAQLNISYPLQIKSGFLLQEIIDNNISIFRAFVNSYYWISHKYIDVESRNLGYYHPIQTELANYFRKLVIEWLDNSNNKNAIKNILFPYMKKGTETVDDDIHKFVINLIRDPLTLTNGVVELYILSVINSIPVVVYDENESVRYIFENGIIHDSLKEEINDKSPYIKNQSVVSIQFTFMTSNIMPSDIDTIYISPNNENL